MCIYIYVPYTHFLMYIYIYLSLYIYICIQYMFCTYIHPHFWSLPNQKRRISKEEPGPVPVKIGNLVQSGRCDQRWILGIGNLDAIGIQNLQETKKMLGQYCWWKKSCTTWHVWNPVNSGIFRYIWHINWCTFFPSTVWQMPLLVLPFIYFWPNYIDRDFSIWKKMVLSTYPPFEWFRHCVCLGWREALDKSRGLNGFGSNGVHWGWVHAAPGGWKNASLAGTAATRISRSLEEIDLDDFDRERKRTRKLGTLMECVCFFVCVFWLIHSLIHVSWIFDEALLVDRSDRNLVTLGFDGTLSDDRFWRWPGDRRWQGWWKMTLGWRGVSVFWMFCIFNIPIIYEW